MIRRGFWKHMPTIGEIVRRLRQQRRLSQRQVTIQSRGAISSGWLGSLESGRIANPHPARLRALAELLGTTLAAIYEEAGILRGLPEEVNDDELSILAQYRALSASDRRRARMILRQLAEAESVEELTDATDTPQAQKPGGPPAQETERAA